MSAHTQVSVHRLPSLALLQAEYRSYLNPSFLYPAASLYHFDMGTIHRDSHGRLMMKLASEGTDILVVFSRRCLVPMADCK